ncbi:class V chitinase-like [Papaver somniferum]|uniref:class V chitinase-like n=1 Tax=Papaver somniferum TaxID=3469 RepID=UPI000E704372|nr:class V chitinase-like [Papaver somniferum]
MSAMASNESNRERFIQSAIDVAQKYGFDGLDLDWEYPSGKTGMQYLAALFVELRGAVDQEAHRKGRAKLGISAAVFFAPDLRLMSPSRSPYPDAVIAKNVDFINLMCYDYAGDWNTTRTGSLAALYGGEYCTSYGIQKWIEAGVPREKLVMGLPLHGRTWKLSDQNNHGIGAPAVGTGPEDDINSRGYMKYHNVVTFNETSSSF